MTIPKKAKLNQIAKAVIVGGKSITQAGIDAGYAPSCAPQAASKLLNSPEGKAEIDRLLDDAGLDQKSIVNEIKRGVQRGRIGSHLDYLDRAMELRGMVDRKNKQDAAPSINLFMNFASKLASNGVIQADGSVRKIEDQ